MAQLDLALWATSGAQWLKTLPLLDAGQENSAGNFNEMQKERNKKDTNLLLHLFHLHLAPLVVGLVESQLSLGASQFVLRLLQLVLQISGEVHIIRK